MARRVSVGRPWRLEMGCNASTTNASANVRQPGPASVHRHQQPQQPQGRPQPQVPPGPTQKDNLKTAPLIKSLVAIHRGKVTLERDNEGTFLSFFVMAAAAGEASLFFRTTGSGTSETLDEPSAMKVSKARFEVGQQQSVRLLLCGEGLRTALEGFDGKDGDEQVVLDLRADSVDETAITVQRSVFKASEDGEGVQLVKQRVRCGGVVRNLDALYGTLPNPRKRTSTIEGPTSSDADGGDCVICLTKPREVAILHCRHVCLCRSCATITSSTWSFQCPVCRGRVAKMVGLDEDMATSGAG